MQRSQINNVVKCFNAIEILGVTFIIAIAFAFQFIFRELPCPLCLLQRLGLLGIAFGFLLNVRYHVRPAHYSLSLLSAVLTSFVALRQIALHITDPDGYGSAILGIHMYTWVFIFCIVAIIYIGLIMTITQQYEIEQDKKEIAEARGKKIRIFSHIAFIIFVLIIAANIISTLTECGLSECPDNPVSYILLSKV
ncbi:disulfide bond formation protein B [Fastidiosibacter lacustris]|uniref:disulfide bond formation protein B n=1 Tax=Fastidiosibacter lacustris TaxID=2056695 RepID=UPI000E3543EC|nr:disulfide bond formation protein B [Fastidiosibacter lacustris]